MESAGVAGGEALALLAERAVESPAQPWIFGPAGLDWRWWSWAQAEAAVAGVAAGLLAAGLPAGGPVSLPAEATPAAVLTWLAAVAAGLTPGWEAVGPAGVRLECVGGPAPERTTFVLARQAGDGPEERLSLGSARRSGTSGTRPEAAARHRREGRPVLLRGRGVAGPEDRALVLWSLRREAALVLEPDPEALAAALLWARPTHLAEPAATLDRLASALPRLAGGRAPDERVRRRSRLRAVWWLGAEPPAAATADYFARVAVAPRPLDLA